jgi:hypothetical protein
MPSGRGTFTYEFSTTRKSGEDCREGDRQAKKEKEAAEK